MTELGVIDENGKKVQWDKIEEVFGPITSQFIVPSEQKSPLLRNLTASPSRLVGCHEYCALEAWYNARVDVFVPYRSFWSMRRGQILHAGLSLPGDETVLFTSFEHNGETIRFGGVCDGYDYDTKTLYEVKTTTWLPDDIKPEHLRQVGYYVYLLNTYGLDVESVVFLYFSFKEWKELRVPVDAVPYPDIVEDIEFYLKCKEERSELGPYEQAEEWKCAYCSYARYCKECPSVVKRVRSKLWGKFTELSCAKDDDAVTLDSWLDPLKVKEKK